MINFIELIENDITLQPKVRIMDEDLLNEFGKKVLYGQIVKLHTKKEAIEVKIVGEDRVLLKGVYTFKDMYHSKSKDNKYCIGLCYYDIKFECITDKFGNFSKNKLYDSYRVKDNDFKVLDDDRDVYSFVYDKDIKKSKDEIFTYAGSILVNSIYESTNNYRGMKKIKA